MKKRLAGYEQQREALIKHSFDTGFIYQDGQLYVEDQPHPQIARKYSLDVTKPLVAGILLHKNGNLYVSFHSYGVQIHEDLEPAAERAIEQQMGQKPIVISYDDMWQEDQSRDTFSKNAKIINLPDTFDSHFEHDDGRRTFIYIVKPDILFLAQNNAYHQSIWNWLYEHYPQEYSGEWEIWDNNQRENMNNVALGLIERNWESRELEARLYWAEGMNRLPAHVMDELSHEFGEKVYQSDWKYPQPTLDWSGHDIDFDRYYEEPDEPTQQWPEGWSRDEGIWPTAKTAFPVSKPHYVDPYLQQLIPNEEYGLEGHCINPKCGQEFTEEDIRPDGTVVCPNCGVRQTVEQADFQQPGGYTRSGLGVTEMGEIGEDIVFKMGELPGVGQITQTLGGNRQPLGEPDCIIESDSIRYGCEIKTNHAQAQARFKIGGSAERQAKIDWCEQNGLQPALIGVRLNFYTDRADIFFRPGLTDTWMGNAQMAHVATVNFEDLNPFKDPSQVPDDLPDQAEESDSLSSLSREYTDDGAFIYDPATKQVYLGSQHFYINQRNKLYHSSDPEYKSQNYEDYVFGWVSYGEPILAYESKEHPAGPEALAAIDNTLNKTAAEFGSLGSEEDPLSYPQWKAINCGHNDTRRIRGNIECKECGAIMKPGLFSPLFEGPDMDEAVSTWPDTLPWGEEGNEYFRTAGYHFVSYPGQSFAYKDGEMWIGQRHHTIIQAMQAKGVDPNGSVLGWFRDGPPDIMSYDNSQFQSVNPEDINAAILMSNRWRMMTTEERKQISPNAALINLNASTNWSGSIRWMYIPKDDEMYVVPSNLASHGKMYKIIYGDEAWTHEQIPFVAGYATRTSIRPEEPWLETSWNFAQDQEKYTQQLAFVKDRLVNGPVIDLTDRVNQSRRTVGTLHDDLTVQELSDFDTRTLVTADNEDYPYYDIGDRKLMGASPAVEFEDGQVIVGRPDQAHIDLIAADQDVDHVNWDNVKRMGIRLEDGTIHWWSWTEKESAERAIRLPQPGEIWLWAKTLPFVIHDVNTQYNVIHLEDIEADKMDQMDIDEWVRLSQLGAWQGPIDPDWITDEPIKPHYESKIATTLQVVDTSDGMYHGCGYAWIYYPDTDTIYLSNTEAYHFQLFQKQQGQEMINDAPKNWGYQEIEGQPVIRAQFISGRYTPRSSSFETFLNTTDIDVIPSNWDEIEPQIKQMVESAVAQLGNKTSADKMDIDDHDYIDYGERNQMGALPLVKLQDNTVLVGEPYEMHREVMQRAGLDLNYGSMMNHPLFKDVGIRFPDGEEWWSKHAAISNKMLWVNVGGHVVFGGWNDSHYGLLKQNFPNVSTSSDEWTGGSIDPDTGQVLVYYGQRDASPTYLERVRERVAEAWFNRSTAKIANYKIEDITENDPGQLLFSKNPHSTAFFWDGDTIYLGSSHPDILKKLYGQSGWESMAMGEEQDKLFGYVTGDANSYWDTAGWHAQVISGSQGETNRESISDQDAIKRAVEQYMNENHPLFKTSTNRFYCWVYDGTLDKLYCDGASFHGNLISNHPELKKKITEYQNQKLKEKEPGDNADLIFSTPPPDLVFGQIDNGVITIYSDWMSEQDYESPYILRAKQLVQEFIDHNPEDTDRESKIGAVHYINIPKTDQIEWAQQDIRQETNPWIRTPDGEFYVGSEGAGHVELLQAADILDDYNDCILGGISSDPDILTHQDPDFPRLDSGEMVFVFYNNTRDHDEDVAQELADLINNLEPQYEQLTLFSRAIAGRAFVVNINTKKVYEAMYHGQAYNEALQDDPNGMLIPVDYLFGQLSAMALDPKVGEEAEQLVREYLNAPENPFESKIASGREELIVFDPTEDEMIHGMYPSHIQLMDANQWDDEERWEHGLIYGWTEDGQIVLDWDHLITEDSGEMPELFARIRQELSNKTATLKIADTMPEVILHNDLDEGSSDLLNWVYDPEQNKLVIGYERDQEDEYNYHAQMIKEHLWEYRPDDRDYDYLWAGQYDRSDGGNWVVYRPINEPIPYEVEQVLNTFKTGKTAANDVIYHVAPSMAREQIQDHGLIPFPEEGEDPNELGVYGWKTLNSAYGCIRDYESIRETPHDIWAIKGDFHWQPDRYTNGVFTEDQIPPDHIELVVPADWNATSKTAQRDQKPVIILNDGTEYIGEPGGKHIQLIRGYDIQREDIAKLGWEWPDGERAFMMDTDGELEDRYTQPPQLQQRRRWFGKTAAMQFQYVSTPELERDSNDIPLIYNEKTNTLLYGDPGGGHTNLLKSMGFYGIRAQGEEELFKLTNHIWWGLYSERDETYIVNMNTEERSPELEAKIDAFLSTQHESKQTPDIYDIAHYDRPDTLHPASPSVRQVSTQSYSNRTTKPNSVSTALGRNTNTDLTNGHMHASRHVYSSKWVKYLITKDGQELTDADHPVQYHADLLKMHDLTLDDIVDIGWLDTDSGGYVSYWDDEDTYGKQGSKVPHQTGPFRVPPEDDVKHLCPTGDTFKFSSISPSLSLTDYLSSSEGWAGTSMIYFGGKEYGDKTHERCIKQIMRETGASFDQILDEGIAGNRYEDPNEGLVTDWMRIPLRLWIEDPGVYDTYATPYQSSLKKAALESHIRDNADLDHCIDSQHWLLARWANLFDDPAARKPEYEFGFKGESGLLEALPRAGTPDFETSSWASRFVSPEVQEWFAQQQRESHIASDEFEEFKSPNFHNYIGGWIYDVPTKKLYAVLSTGEDAYHSIIAKRNNLNTFRRPMVYGWFLDEDGVKFATPWSDTYFISRDYIDEGVDAAQNWLDAQIPQIESHIAGRDIQNSRPWAYHPDYGVIRGRRGQHHGAIIPLQISQWHGEGGVFGHLDVDQNVILYQGYDYPDDIEDQVRRAFKIESHIGMIEHGDPEDWVDDPDNPMGGLNEHGGWNAFMAQGDDIYWGVDHLTIARQNNINLTEPYIAGWIDHENRKIEFWSEEINEMYDDFDYVDHPSEYSNPYLNVDQGLIENTIRFLKKKYPKYTKSSKVESHLSADTPNIIYVPNKRGGSGWGGAWAFDLDTNTLWLGEEGSIHADIAVAMKLEDEWGDSYDITNDHVAVGLYDDRHGRYPRVEQYDYSELALPKETLDWIAEVTHEYLQHKESYIQKHTVGLYDSPHMYWWGSWVYDPSTKKVYSDEELSHPELIKRYNLDDDFDNLIFGQFKNVDDEENEVGVEVFSDEYNQSLDDMAKTQATQAAKEWYLRKINPNARFFGRYASLPITIKYLETPTLYTHAGRMPLIYIPEERTVYFGSKGSYHMAVLQEIGRASILDHPGYNNMGVLDSDSITFFSKAREVDPELAQFLHDEFDIKVQDEFGNRIAATPPWLVTPVSIREVEPGEQNDGRPWMAFPDGQIFIGDSYGYHADLLAALPAKYYEYYRDEQIQTGIYNDGDVEFYWARPGMREIFPRRAIEQTLIREASASIPIQMVDIPAKPENSRAQFGHPVVYDGQTLHIGPLGTHHRDVLDALGISFEDLNQPWSQIELYNIWPKEVRVYNQGDPIGIPSLTEWAEKNYWNKESRSIDGDDSEPNFDDYMGGWVYDPHKKIIYAALGSNGYHYSILKDNKLTGWQEKDFVFGWYLDDPDYGRIAKIWSNAYWSDTNQYDDEAEQAAQEWLDAQMTKNAKVNEVDVYDNRGSGARAWVAFADGNIFVTTNPSFHSELFAALPSEYKYGQEKYNEGCITGLIYPDGTLEFYFVDPNRNWDIPDIRTQLNQYLQYSSKTATLDISDMAEYAYVKGDRGTTVAAWGITFNHLQLEEWLNEHGEHLVERGISKGKNLPKDTILLSPNWEDEDESHTAALPGWKIEEIDTTQYEPELLSVRHTNDQRPVIVDHDNKTVYLGNINDHHSDLSLILRSNDPKESWDYGVLEKDGSYWPVWYGTSTSEINREDVQDLINIWKQTQKTATTIIPVSGPIDSNWFIWAYDKDTDKLYLGEGEPDTGAPVLMHADLIDVIARDRGVQIDDRSKAWHNLLNSIELGYSDDGEIYPHDWTGEIDPQAERAISQFLNNPKLAAAPRIIWLTPPASRFIFIVDPINNVIYLGDFRFHYELYQAILDAGMTTPEDNGLVGPIHGWINKNGVISTWHQNLPPEIKGIIEQEIRKQQITSAKELVCL